MTTNIHPQALRRLLLALVAVTLVTALAACVGVDVPTDETEPAPTEAPAEEPTAEAVEEAEAEADAPTPEPVQETVVNPVDTTPMESERPLAEVDPMERNGYYTEAPEMIIDPDTHYYATIETDKGDIRVQLFADRAPMTVNNFVYLANQGYYDNTSFHRVLDGFMAQAGDPTGTGTGGPGYQFADEIVPGLGFDRPGLLAMANAGPGTNGSQFFITFAPTDWLNGRHTIFGEVIEGSGVLGELTRRDPNAAPDFEGDLINAVIIEEGAESALPTPTPLPPTPTPYPPTSMDDAGDRPLADVPVEERSGYFNSPPEMVIDTDKTYQAIISTDAGDIVVELYDDIAPNSVNNFVVLANLGFFDGIPVNQVIPEQVVIIGSPGNSPDSDAGYQFEAELNLDVTPARGSLAYIPIQGTNLASSSVMLLALIDPPAEANTVYSFFGQAIEGVDLLEELSSENMIESVMIEEVE